MSVQSELGELERRHRAFDAELAEMLAHPSTNNLQLTDLKRRKLLVKDQIARLKGDLVCPAAEIFGDYCRPKGRDDVPRSVTLLAIGGRPGSVLRLPHF
jgi:hypothetical protein